MAGKTGEKSGAKIGEKSSGKTPVKKTAVKAKTARIVKKPADVQKQAMAPVKKTSGGRAAGKKPAGKTAKAVKAVKPAKLAKPRARGVKKSKELKKILKKINAKSKPAFRGRFGVRSVRRKKNKKWQKWRVPRGIDILRRIEHGAYPKAGYGTRKEIRGMHPSGFYEVLVHNVAEVGNVDNKKFVARIAAGVGKRKRIEIVKKAKESEVRILNR